ncbi:Ubiquitin-associated domain/translation elongation factor EF-Ts [Cocos nucifera]|uniref:Ubiquitin-associated domain/translation elongation factor EF-Ts n=1 Tax=Cocos nucifera TaxID=13894 RepID=A0A8K0HW64_COCNU|nr:Ubiquitin-associated domain/translation elongation factor EF-Ts [Cocos nucifera]
MSPASKSKSKTRAAKDQLKVSSKPSPATANGSNGVPAGAYNPVLGTFHTLETTTSASLPGTHSNGRFRTIDETEEHSSSSHGTAGEFDSASNNGSCSGESEDQKEKMTSATPRIEPIPGCDTDKRDKIRQKNERKHQRQRERRAQELYERCSGYLMSRKLETLAQQLVQMGFSSESATMALIQNEGRLEESIAWLFEVGEERKQEVATNLEGGVNLKIDITDELARIADMEVRFKCTKQEVERAVVACEGDLEKAEETLKAQKQEPAPAPLKLEESGDPAAVSSSNNKMAMSAQSPAGRTQVKGIALAAAQQQRKDERDFNHAKSAATGAVSQESVNRNLQSSRRQQPKPAPLEKRWSSTSSAPSVSFSASPLQAAVSSNKPEARYVMAGNEVKANIQAGTLREPVIVMQRPQSVNAKQSITSTSLGISASQPASTGWHSNGVPGMEVMKVADGGLAHSLSSLGLNGSYPQQFVPQTHFQTFVSSPMESGAMGWAGSWNSIGTSSSSLAVPSSLGLFTGWGSSGSSASSPVDWSTGGSTARDYASIDWTLDLALLRPSVKTDRLSDTWSTMSMGGKVARPVVNDCGVYGSQYGSLASDPTSSSGSHEWTSPFAGKDLFRVPRQFVTSPSL